jgi:hypothetical protein
MRDQIIAFLKGFEQAVFPNQPLQIILAHDRSPSKEHRPLVFIPHPKALKPDFHQQIYEGKMPQEDGFYLFFPERVKPYVDFTQQREQSINPQLVLWSMCIAICWQRAQYEQETLAKPKISSAPHLDHLLLTASQMCEAVASVQIIDVTEIAAKFEQRATELWPRYGLPLVKKGMQEYVAWWMCRRSAECDLLCAIALWCKTEENVIHFLLKMKEALFEKVATLP